MHHLQEIGVNVPSPIFFKTVIRLLDENKDINCPNEPKSRLGQTSYNEKSALWIYISVLLTVI